MNIQGAQVEPDLLRGFNPNEDSAKAERSNLEDAIPRMFSQLLSSARPVIIAGAGIRTSGTAAAFLEFAEKLQVPVVTAFNAHDLIWNDHSLYVGRQGTGGDRAGNFVVQNSDFLLALGCRLSIRQVSYDWKKFARHAYKVMVDVDSAELQKPTLSIDLPIHSDLKDFFPAAMTKLSDLNLKPKWDGWIEWGKIRQNKYPVTLPEYWEKQSPINAYCAVDMLFKKLQSDDVVVCGDGTACVVAFQTGYIKRGQRLYHNSGSAPMGYDLPAAVGACLANDKKRVICLTGDGSIQMNIQELQTIVTHKLPIKIVVINNGGYHSIRQTQKNYFKDSPIGYDSSTGVSLPNFSKLAYAYDIPFEKSDSLVDFSERLDKFLNKDGPGMFEVCVQVEQPFAPKLSSRKLPDGRMASAPLEDMAPFLSRDELKSNMIVPLCVESVDHKVD